HRDTRPRATGAVSRCESGPTLWATVTRRETGGGAGERLTGLVRAGPLLAAHTRPTPEGGLRGGGDRRAGRGPEHPAHPARPARPSPGDALGRHPAAAPARALARARPAAPDHRGPPAALHPGGRRGDPGALDRAPDLAGGGAGAGARPTPGDDHALLVRAPDDDAPERPGGGARAPGPALELGAGAGHGPALPSHPPGAVRDRARGTAVARAAARGPRAAGTGASPASRPDRDAGRRAALDRAPGDGAGGSRLRRSGSSHLPARAGDAPARLVRAPAHAHRVHRAGHSPHRVRLRRRSALPLALTPCHPPRGRRVAPRDGAQASALAPYRPPGASGGRARGGGPRIQRGRARLALASPNTLATRARTRGQFATSTCAPWLVVSGRTSFSSSAVVTMCVVSMLCAV